MKNRNNPKLKLYAFTLFLEMCWSNGVSFTRYLPTTPMYLFFFFMPIVFLVSTKLENNKKNTALCIWLVVIQFMALCSTMITSAFTVINNISATLYICSVLLMTQSDKEYLLNFITKCMTVILAVSIPAWILYLAGGNLPHGPAFEHENGFHELYDYYFFFASAKLTDNIIPRFSSIFLEAGQLATPCAFLFFANGASFKKENILFLIAILLSFSLVGYGLIIGGLFLNSITAKGKGRFWKIMLFVAVVGSISFMTIKAANEDNPLYSLIFQRLEYDDENGIAGNNRTSDEFENHYEQFMQSSDKWFGVGSEMEYGNNWAVNSSGVKKYIVYNGIVGLFIILYFTFLLYKKNKSAQSFSFFCVVVVGFLVRDLLRTSFWLIIVILGFYILGPRSKIKGNSVTAGSTVVSNG